MWQVRASRPDSCQSHSECGGGGGAARETGVTGGGLTALTGGGAGTVGMQRASEHAPTRGVGRTHTPAWVAPSPWQLVIDPQSYVERERKRILMTWEVEEEEEEEEEAEDGK